MKEELKSKLDRMGVLLEDIATGRKHEVDQIEFQSIRNYLIDSEIASLLPDFIGSRRTIDQFWNFIREVGQENKYSERREFLRIAFSPIYDFLENEEKGISAAAFRDAAEKFAPGNLKSEFKKAYARTANDPEGAITSARTLIESVCKYIIEQSGQTIQNDDLPPMYRQVAKLLSLAPSEHNEQIFKQILGGIESIVLGLAGLRNKLGDAHGKDSAYKKPSPRHARLAVNSASALCVFLLETFEAKAFKETQSMAVIVDPVVLAPRRE